MRFLQFTDKEEVMSVAWKELKDKVFSMYDNIPKDLFDLCKQQQKKFTQARDKGYRVHFSKAHPHQLFVNGKFLPPDQPLKWTCVLCYKLFSTTENFNGLFTN